LGLACWQGTDVMSTRQWIVAAACSAALFALAEPAVAAGDAGRGAQVFQACIACHSAVPGEHLTGPSLGDVWQRKAGAAKGFARYSPALRRANVTWDEATLDKWLADPQKFIPGTTMAFAGLKEPNDREDVIAYLRAVSEKKAAPPKGGGIKDRKPDLHKAPPQELVKALSYCRDTYTVETADGKSRKVWEFNLRLKTDSSDLGPAPGRPVIVGTGMQGDRAAVVFSSPFEVSAFVKKSCR